MNFATYREKSKKIIEYIIENILIVIIIIVAIMRLFKKIKIIMHNVNKINGLLIKLIENKNREKYAIKMISKLAKKI